MKTLDLTQEEAVQLMEDDKRIDKGEKLFELSKSENEVARKMKNCARAVDAYGKARTRERKVDDDKQMIINYLQSTLKNWFQSNSQCTYNACTNFEIVNPEREFLFTYNGKKYKIVLSAPRS